ncbi:MAG: SAM-dependent methyltransferase [Candidatus Didemnitutus sp.]|nr:SAM-dependent methyltransferase [Candidatus Didemnitutus sp.]
MSLCPPSPVVSEFLDALAACVSDGTFHQLTLGKTRSADPTLRNVVVRPVTLKAGPHLSFLWQHETQTVTKNFASDAAVAEIRPLLGTTFYSAHLFTAARVVQLEFNKKTEPRLTFGKPSHTVAETTPPPHDRAKSRLLPAESAPWLHRLGITNATGVVREGMADKHRQIHKFVELLSHLAADAPLPADRPIEIADMGCGKGYLTFATHDYFSSVANRPVRVTGVELRPALVASCNALARETGRLQLRFQLGSIADARLPNPDVLIALHACDTATDDAIARGLAVGSALIVTAPCCQKELRPQLAAAAVLAPALRHGIFQERHAEFVTDALRALLLEWSGYRTKVFEFISTEHTAKNVMIAATKLPSVDDATRERTAHAIRELASFYGIKSHTLARHLNFPLST